MSSLNGSHFHISKVIYYLNKNNYNYNIGDNKWYKFQNNGWIIIYSLNDLIENKSIEYYNKIIDYCKNNKVNSFNKIIKKVQNIINLLRSSLDKQYFIKELINMYKDENKDNIMFKLNSNPYLLGFNNGIYDFEQMIFRNGKTNDYISMSVGYDYVPKYSDQKLELDKFLEYILPNEEERNYLLTYLSLCLVGINNTKLFTLFINGNKLLINLIFCVFGDYFSFIPSKILTKQLSNIMYSDIMHLLNKRIIIANNFDKNDKLDCDLIKSISGNNLITLYQNNNTIIFESKFKIFLTCENIPVINNIDTECTNKIRSIKFLNVLNSDLINNNVKKWKNDFILLLIEHYKKYNETKILVPTYNILKWNYNIKSNMFVQFMDENTKFIDGEHIHCSILYKAFINWYTKKYNEKNPSNKEFIKKLAINNKIEKIKIKGLTQLGIRNLKII
jgi:phage/plasmid-associated DNA primase